MMFLRQSAAVTTALIAALTLSGCGTGPRAAGPANPAAAAPGIAAPERGALLSMSAQPVGATLAHARERVLITYRSRGATGAPIVASGYVLIPRGTPPAGGWPVLAWAHGTTGVADTCAPSGIYRGGPEWDYQQVSEQALEPWLAQGWAVVAPDYEGLGTPGPHPYMDAASQRHTVIDAVRAARHLPDAPLAADWVVLGHSQGGAAALSVAAAEPASDLRLLGAIAAAPGGYDYAGIARYVQQNPQPPKEVAVFLPIVLLGAAAADPRLDVDALVHPDMEALLNLARSRCLSELRTEVTKAPAGVFLPNVDLAPLLAYLKAQSIENLSPRVPVLFVQGEADALVDARGVRAYYRQLCAAGKQVRYQGIAGGNHRDALRRSAELGQGFAAQLLAGGAPVEACKPD